MSRVESWFGPRGTTAIESGRIHISFGHVLKAEFLKGKRAAPVKMLIGFCLAVVLGVLVGWAAGFNVATLLNYWYALLLPAFVVLTCVSVVNLDAKHHWRATSCLPVDGGSVWIAKITYCVALSATEIALVLLIVTIGGGSIGLGEAAAAGLSLLVTSAWMIPAALALADGFGTLVGVLVTFLLDEVLSIVMWSNATLWMYCPPGAMLDVVVPMLKVMPSGVPVPMEPDSPLKTALATFGSQHVTALAVSLLVFLLLSALTAVWFSGKEQR